MKQIVSLKENEVFVFGSNANGNHAGGAARQAVESFGAIMGQAKCLQGQSYGIVTLDENMQKVSLDYIKEQLQGLADFAEENEDKTFLLTLIGCGIAGFTTSEIRSVARLVNFPDNVVVPDEFKVFYKAFDKDLKCRGFQYEVGKEYEENRRIEICERGFHAVENPLEVFDYYPMDSRFAEVEQGGDTQHESGNTKCCSSKIRINAELKFGDIIKLGVDWIIRKTSRKFENNSSGYGAQIGSSGYGAQIGSSGDCAKIGSSGDCAKIGSSGDGAQIGSSGDGAQIGSSGYGAKIGSSGYGAQITSSGKNAVVMCAGDGSIAKAKKGSWITLAEWKRVDGEWTPVCVKTVKVDGRKIKEDTWYKLENGKFVEVED